MQHTPIKHLPRITQLVGAMVIKHDDCQEEDAQNGSELGPDDTLIPGKNSSCVVRAFGKQLAIITKNKASDRTHIISSHPLAPHRPGSKIRLKSTSLKTDNWLLLQAQRENPAGKMVVSTLKVQF